MRRRRADARKGAARLPAGLASLLVAFGLGAALAACGDPASPVSTGSAPGTDELAAHQGQACPAQLPPTGEHDHGFGPYEAAESEPSVAAGMAAAWVCRYEPVDAQLPDGAVTFDWKRWGPVVEVPTSELGALTDRLGDLGPAPEPRACNDDLGLRWLLVTADEGGDLTGVQVDDFGCGSVRLTDDPHGAVAGTTDGDGTVPGVHEGPGLLDVLKQLAS